MLGIIEYLHAKKILDSRGKRTIEVDVNGFKAASPSGTSTGTYEAGTLDADKSVKIVNEKLQQLVGMELDQDNIDKELEKIDGTGNFSKIGGNTAVAVSFAVYRAIGAKKIKNKFPYPLGNVFGGGAHGGKTDIQEFLVIPLKAKTMKEAVETNKEVYDRMRNELKKHCGSVRTNYEGALTAPLSDIKFLDVLSDIAEDSGVRLGLDIAATEFWNGSFYKYKKLKKNLKFKEQIDFVLDLIRTYKLFYVEDPLHEDDFQGFSELSKKAKCLVCGDDLFVTNARRLEKGISEKSGNSIIIKPNQVGTVSRAFETVKLAKKNKYTPVISHRSGETTDFTIAELAVDWQIPIIKTGIFGDVRTAKLNRLIDLWKKAEKPRMSKVV